jgi:predicted metal-dependent hydrolase
MIEPRDPRYVAGIELFNRGEYFEAHEVWEDLWQDCPSADRRFYQALIQAAVAVYHFDRDNYIGAARLARSGKRYMEPFHPTYRGLDVVDFWGQVEAYIAPSLTEGEADFSNARPVIVLAPAAAGSP